jgi:hypothetical protein
MYIYINLTAQRPNSNTVWCIYRLIYFIFVVLKIFLINTIVVLLNIKEGYSLMSSALDHSVADVVEWSSYRALDISLSDWCCSVSMVCVSIISLKINLFSPWHSWKITELALNNNHSHHYSLWTLVSLYFSAVFVSVSALCLYSNNPSCCADMSPPRTHYPDSKTTSVCFFLLNAACLEEKQQIPIS